jgi:hypothetical protein
MKCKHRSVMQSETIADAWVCLECGRYRIGPRFGPLPHTHVWLTNKATKRIRKAAIQARKNALPPR